MYAVAFFKVVQQQTINEVANSITCLWADNFCLNNERIIKIGQYLRKLCSNEKESSFLTRSVDPLYILSNNHIYLWFLVSVHFCPL